VRGASGAPRTIVVQNAGSRVFARDSVASSDDFHTVFHSFCEDRVTSATVI
jgi:hypothetical protein